MVNEQTPNSADTSEREEAIAEFAELCAFLESAVPQGVSALSEVMRRVDEFSAKFCNYREKTAYGRPMVYEARDWSWKVELSEYMHKDPHFLLRILEPKEWVQRDNARIEGMRDESFALLRLQFGGKIGFEEMLRLEPVEFTLAKNTLFRFNERGAFVSLPAGTRFLKKAGDCNYDRLVLTVPALGMNIAIPREHVPPEGYDAIDIRVGKTEKK